MKTLSFSREHARHVDHFVSDFWMARLVHGPDVHVGCMYFDAGDHVGRHPATTWQIFAVVAGSGWVEGSDGERRPVAAGEAALWQPGEEHAAGTDEGMTAIVVEADVLAGPADGFGPDD